MTTTSRPTTAGIVRAIRSQLKFIAERGTTTAGYVAFYAQYGRDPIEAANIQRADVAALKRLIDQAQTATGPVTVATMILAGGGSPTVYGIFRAKLRVRRGERWWDLNAPSSERIATVTVRGSQVAPTPDEVTAALREHATPEAPAFDFRGGFLLDEPVAAVMPS